MPKSDFKRTCPRCSQVIVYSNYSAYYMANRRNSCCGTCKTEKIKGEGNPFYGKTHTVKAKAKIGYFNAEIRELSEEFLQTARKNLAKVSNERPLYDIWVDTYGKEEADRLLIGFKKKQSESHRGEKNHMFGKPSPQGSGNGWSGWYKDWYFRSLRELSYMIKVLEAQQLVWETPDKNFKIPYTDRKSTRLNSSH